MRHDDGRESDVTFLVQRVSDNTLLVMKYIVVDGDVERLVSMREVEALSILNGHPHVIQYYDMFMNYSFSDSAFGETQATFRLSRVVPDGTTGLLGGTSDCQPGGSLASTARTSGDNTVSSLRSGSCLEQKSPLDERRQLLNHRYMCLVMEYMPEGNLSQWAIKYCRGLLPSSQRNATDVEHLPPVPEQILISVAFQLNSLLRFMHHDSQPPIIHKGLKPENIFVTAPPNAQQTFLPILVSDFGFSVLGNYGPPQRRAQRRSSSDLDGTSDLGGRSSMAMPMDGLSAVESTSGDMWSFGAVLYSLSTCRFGHRMPNLAELVTAKRDKATLELRREVRERGYSVELASFIVSFLNGDEKLRPTAAAVLKLFSRSQEGMLVLTTHKSDSR
jgi:serine/threonine protein kinase